MMASKIVTNKNFSMVLKIMLMVTDGDNNDWD